MRRLWSCRRKAVMYWRSAMRVRFGSNSDRHRTAPNAPEADVSLLQRRASWRARDNARFDVVDLVQLYQH